LATSAYKKLASILAALTGTLGLNACSFTSAPAGNSWNVYSEVAGTVSRYYDALAQADKAMLDELLAPIWNGKHLAAPNNGLAIGTKDALLARVLEQGPTPIKRGQPQLTSVQVYFADFAIARADDWERAGATIFILFKLQGVWRIVGEASAGAEFGVRQKRFNPFTAQAEVLRVLDVYYRAVEAGEPEPLRNIFDPGWQMKNHEGTALVAEDKATFLSRIARGPLAEYADDRQVADVQIVYDRLAYVRIDKPSKSVVTVFLFFRLGGGWVMVDKAFSSLEK
jgi:Putative lumazine-binding